MKSDARWMRILAIRVLANAIVGGLWFALVGAFCGALVNAFLIFLGSGLADLPLAVLIPGAVVGFSTGVIGTIIYAIAAAFAAPERFLSPFWTLSKHVALGQIVGTLSVSSAFWVFWMVKAQITGTSLTGAMNSNYFIIAAPILMICGAIAGALSKRDLPQSATLNAE